MRTKLFIVLLALFSLQAKAWDWWPLPMAEPDTCHEQLLYVSEVGVLASGGKGTPTWLQANRNGAVSPMPFSGSVTLGVVKPATRDNRWFDYDGGIVLSGRIAGATTSGSIDYTGFFKQLYAHVRLYIVDVTVGIKPQYFGAGDPELSSGSILFSQNVHPIPRISIGIDRWTAIPGLFGYAEIKGGLTHGWLGDNNGWVKGTLLHYKYIGARVGGKLSVNVSYEFHHVAQWGGFSSTYGDLGNDFASFWNVLLGKSGGSTSNELLNAQGNHLFSQQLCLTAKGEKWHVNAYWQNINEDGPVRFIGATMNAKDGLWGVSAEQQYWPFICALTFEVLQTTDQSGPWHDRDGQVFGGNDSYYKNSIYRQGWTYFGRTIGSPLMSPSNSRVWAYHAGVRGDIYGFKYRAVCTYADNYGTYNAPAVSHNTAVLLEVKKRVPQAWNLEFGVALAGDFGTQYGNQFGGMITVSKQGIIKKW